MMMNADSYDDKLRQLIIRPGTVKDIDAIHAMQVDWAGEECTYGYGPATLTDIVAQLGPYLLVADSGTQLVGFISGTVHVSDGLAVIANGEHYLEVDDLYVRPAFRDSGIGGQLLERLLEVARGNGIERFLVYSATKDLDRIVAFYRTHGFRSWSIQMFI